MQEMSEEQWGILGFNVLIFIASYIWKDYYMVTAIKYSMWLFETLLGIVYMFSTYSYRRKYDYEEWGRR